MIRRLFLLCSVLLFCSNIEAQDGLCTSELDVNTVADSIQSLLDADGNQITLAPFALSAPLMQDASTDGTVAPGEYANSCTFQFHDRQNPGMPLPSIDNLQGGEEDLSLTMHLGHSEQFLYLAFEVTDDFADADPGVDPTRNDGIELYFNPDIANDGRNWSREALHLSADAAAQFLLSDFVEDGIFKDNNLSVDFNGRTSEGGPVQPAFGPGIDPNGTNFYTAGMPVPGTANYTIEWQIPLNAFDKADGAEFEAVTTGDSMLFNAVVNDNDTTGANDQETHAMLWLVEEDPRSPWQGAEVTWPIALHLAPASRDPADLDNDGDCDADDIDLLAAAIRDGDSNPIFDVNKDGSIDATDHADFITITKNTWFGDANLDGQFSTADFVSVFTTALYETGNPAGWADGDWNGDGLFNTRDFIAAFSQGGFEQGPRPEPEFQAVPEPASIVLVLIGFFAYVLQVRVRR